MLGGRVPGRAAVSWERAGQARTRALGRAGLGWSAGTDAARTHCALWGSLRGGGAVPGGRVAPRPWTGRLPAAPGRCPRTQHSAWVREQAAALCRSPSPDPEPLLVRYATLSESQDWPGRSPFPRPRQEGPACRMPPEPWASLCSGHALCPPARQPVSRPGPGRLPPRVLCAPWPGHRPPATRCLGLLVVCVRMGCPGSPGCEAGGLTPSRFASQEPGDART